MKHGAAKANATGSVAVFSVCSILEEVYSSVGFIKGTDGRYRWKVHWLEKPSLAFRIDDDSSDYIVSHILDTNLSILPINDVLLVC